MGRWKKLRETILERTVPDKLEEDEIKSFSETLTQKLQRRFTERKVSVEIHGSISRGTWVKGDRDIDVFLVMEEKYAGKTIKEILETVKEFTGPEYIEAYAEHPYVQATLNGFKVEFVPCYRIKPGEGLISSTDRTPLHTRYLEKNLRREQKNEVRLLKQFMKGINVYGAEIKTKGFSGYLTELLVIKNGSFKETLKSAAEWRNGTVIQHNTDQEEEKLRKKFKDPLIVIDPVDPNRNVASSISEETFWNFVAASKSFMENPDEKYFFPRVEAPPIEEIIEGIQSSGKDIIFHVVKDKTRNVPDILWGQLYKTQEAVKRLLVEKEFQVLRTGIWSDEETVHIFLYELETNKIPAVHRQPGPPVHMHRNSGEFLQTHKGKNDTVSGPGIEGSRWWVQKKRRHTDAVKLLEEVVLRGENSIGVSKGLDRKIKEESAVLLNQGIRPYITEDLARYLKKFLKGGPDWLD